MNLFKFDSDIPPLVKWFTVLFTLFHLLYPLTYYYPREGADPLDERFCWRMFSDIHLMTSHANYDNIVLSILGEKIDHDSGLTVISMIDPVVELAKSGKVTTGNLVLIYHGQTFILLSMADYLCSHNVTNYICIQKGEESDECTPSQSVAVDKIHVRYEAKLFQTEVVKEFSFVCSNKSVVYGIDNLNIKEFVHNHF